MNEDRKGTRGAEDNWKVRRVLPEIRYGGYEVLNRNIEGFLGCESDYESADIVLYGAPFDGTTSYRPGTRFGPKAIRGESYGVESYSPYQDSDLTDLHVMDSGDLELPIGDVKASLEAIYKPREGHPVGRQAAVHAGRGAPGHAAGGEGRGRRSTRTFASSTSTPTRT